VDRIPLPYGQDEKHGEEMKMEYHPIADLFPMLEGAEYEAFKEGIRNNGLLDSITVYEGKILDGRNRHKACLELGIECRISPPLPFGMDPYKYVVEKNLHRRHLSIADRAIIADEMANLAAGNPTLNPIAPRGAITQRQASKLMGVGRRTVQRVRVIKKSGNKKLIEDVKSGKIKINEAAKQVTGEAVNKVKKVKEEKPDRYIGKTFGGILCKSFNGLSKGGHRKYVCICHCGKEFIGIASQLGRNTKSCGCSRRGTAGNRINKTTEFIPVTKNQFAMAEAEKDRLNTVLIGTGGFFKYFANADVPVLKSVCNAEEIKEIGDKLNTLARHLNSFKKLFFSKEEEKNGNGDS
jgi:hypothetical protein